MASAVWHKLRCVEPIALELTLRNGQVMPVRLMGQSRGGCGGHCGERAPASTRPTSTCRLWGSRGDFSCLLVQCFGWTILDNGHARGVLRDCVVTLRSVGDDTEFVCNFAPPTTCVDDLQRTLEDTFRTQVGAVAMVMGML